MALLEPTRKPSSLREGSLPRARPRSPERSPSGAGFGARDRLEPEEGGRRRRWVLRLSGARATLLRSHPVGQRGALPSVAERGVSSPSTSPDPRGWRGRPFTGRRSMNSSNPSAWSTRCVRAAKRRFSSSASPSATWMALLFTTDMPLSWQAWGHCQTRRESGGAGPRAQRARAPDSTGWRMITAGAHR